MHHSLQTNSVLWLNPLVPGLNAWYDLKKDYSRQECEKLHKCSHNLSLAVVDIQGFEHHSACYISMMFSVTEHKKQQVLYRSRSHCPCAYHEGVWDSVDITHSFLTLALDRNQQPGSCSGHIIPVLTEQEAGWPKNWFAYTGQEILHLVPAVN
jgi:hypothetical protein